MGEYKVGDRVVIIRKRGFGWNPNGKMDKYMGTVMTIRSIFGDNVKMVEDKGERFGDGWLWHLSDIECLAQEREVEISPDEFLEVLKGGH